MTRSEMFKAAHLLAKQYQHFVGDYRVAFSHYLKILILNEKEAQAPSCTNGSSALFDESEVLKYQQKMIDYEIESEDEGDEYAIYHYCQCKQRLRFIQGKLVSAGLYSEGIDYLINSRYKSGVAQIVTQRAIQNINQIN